MIEKSQEDGVQILRLARPEKKNALTGAMYSELAEALEQANLNDAVRCQLICGQPGIFTAGNDIADFMDFAGRGELTGTPVVRFLRALVNTEKPLVAAVDGAAVGVGTTLLMHCDMVFATPQAVMLTPFTDLGLSPEAGSSLLGPRLMGPVKAFELLALGRPFSAQKALEAGLINEIVEEAEAAALACAKEIAQKPPEAMGISRRLLKGDRAELAERVEEEINLFAERLRSPEAIAAFDAFLTKKPKG